MKPFRIFFALLLLGLSLILTGCAELFPKSGQNATQPLPTDPSAETVSVLPEGWDVTTAPTDKLTVEELTMVVTESTIRELEELSLIHI